MGVKEEIINEKDPGFTPQQKQIEKTNIKYIFLTWNSV